jgi:uncharacterized protein (TIRG00374 family)
MKILPRRFQLILTALVLIAFVAYFIANRTKFKPLLDVNIWLLLLVAGFNVIVIFANGLFTKFILEPFNKSIPMRESFFVSLLSSVGNFFAPVGAGFGFRAIYLKRKFDLPYSEYISSLSGNYIIVFLVNSFFGLLSLYLLSEKQNGQYSILSIIFSIIFLVSAALTVLKIPVGKANSHTKIVNSFWRNLGRVTEGWHKIVSHPKLLIRLVLLTVFNLAITILITWTIIRALHFHISFAPLLLFSVLGTLSLFINLTPANLGVKEAIYLFSSTVLGYSAVQVLSIALIDRGVLFLVLLVLWVFSGRFKERSEFANSRP